MTIKNGDIVQLASKVMDDVPNGGGGPSSTIIPFGQSNSAFDDISDTDRAGGDVSVRQMFSWVRTAGVERLLDSHLIISHLPTDPNVSITLAACGMFAKRSEIAQAIANYLIPGSEWSGFLLEDHVAGQRSIEICHRVGTPAPTDGRTLLLIQDEGKGTAKFQYVRVVSSETTTRTFTYAYNTGSGYVDYQVSVTQCVLQDPLRVGFKGSPPSRTISRASDGAMIRDTRVADASVYYGASTLTAIATMDSNILRIASIYTQVVPNSRSERAVLDQRPAAQRLLSLASTPRAVDVAVTPHSLRIRVTQENRGYAWTALLRPLPAFGTITIAYMAMGDWYTITEDLNTVTSDGSGTFTGDGSGTAKHQTGSLAFTTKEMPDVGSSIIITWGERSAYTNRSGQTGYRMPEFSWVTPHAPLKPGSVVVTWYSGGVLKTATDNGTGGFTGHASGEINYATGRITLRPTAMIDPGSEFHTDYRYTSQRIEHFTNLTVDAAGFAAIPLQATPVPRSIKLDWLTQRSVSSSAGTSDFVSNAATDQAAILETRTQTVFVPDLKPPVAAAAYAPPIYQSTQLTTATALIAPGGNFDMTLVTHPDDGDGLYHWTAHRSSGPDTAQALDVSSGTVQVAERKGVFSFKTVTALDADFQFTVTITKSGGPVLATSELLTVDINELVATPDVGTYTTSLLNAGLSTVTPGEKRWCTFKGPVVGGAYLWDMGTVDHPESFEATSGSFSISHGDGGFWLNVKASAVDTNFNLRVKRQDGTVLALYGMMHVRAVVPASPIKLPPAAIKTRDPISSAEQLAVSNSSAKAIAGMYAGGVRTDGSRIYVAVFASYSEEFGAYYDPPASESEIWTVAQLADGQKPLQSLNGHTTTYQLWGLRNQD